MTIVNQDQMNKVFIFKLVKFIKISHLRFWSRNWKIIKNMCLIRRSQRDWIRKYTNRIK